ncbi:MAG: hypothetical protein QXJ73_08530 [Candidatus Caldarchaeum sp.]
MVTIERQMVGTVVLVITYYLLTIVPKATLPLAILAFITGLVINLTPIEKIAEEAITDDLDQTEEEQDNEEDEKSVEDAEANSNHNIHWYVNLVLLTPVVEETVFRIIPFLLGGEKAAAMVTGASLIMHATRSNVGMVALGVAHAVFLAALHIHVLAPVVFHLVWNATVAAYLAIQKRKKPAAALDTAAGPTNRQP